MQEATSLSASVAMLVFLGAVVIGVPLLRFAGLSAVLGYLLAGLVIGPSGFGFFREPEMLRVVAEFGIVMFLFVIGLELKPSKLLSLRRDMLGLGLGHLVVMLAALTGLLAYGGLKGIGLYAASFAFALSATAIALQILEERGAMPSTYGQKSFAVLLFQDIASVPVIAALPLLAGGLGSRGATDEVSRHLPEIATALAALVGLVAAGRYLLNPFFRLLARAHAREVMTAAALLVVLGAAEAMHKVGLSAALGAFVAGLMLSESHFRHQLEADIEPFRSLLLGLFFMSVGMSIEMKLVVAQAPLVLGGTLAVFVTKFGLAYGLFRLARLSRHDAARAAVILSSVGEFAFVIIPLAEQNGFIKEAQATLLSAIAALTMILAPVAARVLELLIARRGQSRAGQEIEEDYSSAEGEVLVIGFGRFGQVVNQMFLAAERSVTVIDRNIDRIRAAGTFGFKVYYGDGRRLDVLKAAGAENARIIAICLDDREAATRITEMARRAFPQARLYVRAYDRIHALELMERGVRSPVRETFDSALTFGREALMGLGLSGDEAEGIRLDVRRRDIQRLDRQRDEGLLGGAELLHGTTILPAPLSEPRRKRRDISTPAPHRGGPEDTPPDGTTGVSS